MMTEQPAGEHPGHLDIDAVSAFIDRDLQPDEVLEVESHLAACPACRREVLEIHATVLLLAGLPQYTPRRSFCLSGEHVRAARRSRSAWPKASPLTAHSYPAPAAQIATDRYAGAYAGLHAAALVIGALLLLVTSSDLFGIPPQPAAMLEPESVPMVMTERPLPPPAAPEEPAARMAPAPTAVMVTATAFAAESAFATLPEQSDGTFGDYQASEGLQATDSEAPRAPDSVTTSLTAGAFQTQPTAAAGLTQNADRDTRESVGAAAEQAVRESGEPSRLRLVQIALAFALAWLVVTIAGLRWVRRLR